MTSNIITNSIMANMMLIRITIFGTMVLAVTFAFLSIAGNYWIGNGNLHFGLWRICRSGVCTDYPDALKSGTFSLFSLKLFIKYILW